MARKNKPSDVFKHIDMSAGPDACWPWKGSTGGGTAKSKPRPYFQIDGRKQIAYRVVWEQVKGVTLNANIFLCHTCDNSVCCNPTHLREGDNASNMAEMVERDRHGLTHATVRGIRLALMIGKLTHDEIAQIMDTSRATVGRIARDEMHTHEEDYPT